MGRLGDEMMAVQPEHWTSWAEALEEIGQALGAGNLAKLPVAVGCPLVFLLILVVFKLAAVFLRHSLRPPS